MKRGKGQITKSEKIKKEKEIKERGKREES